ncbi:MAG: PQQ-binding-like beta-propeller repeat protein [Planctomycetota bacterium]
MISRLVAFSTLTCLLVFDSSCLHAENWPCWRGPTHDGISTEQGVPLRWSPTENVLWKTPIVGIGHSSPVVWEDHLFVTSCITEELSRVLYCVERETGEIRWQRVVAKCPIEKMHRDNTPASATPATDGQHVFVAFQVNDEIQVTAYDFDGNLAWQVAPGSFESRHGFCTSLVLDEEKLFVSGLQDGPDAFVAALNKGSGETIWKVEREEKVRSFSSPFLCTVGETPALLLSGANQTIAYDRESGATLRMVPGPAAKTVSSIVRCPESNLAFVCGGRDNHFFALSLDSETVSSAGDYVWTSSKGIPYMTSPLVYNGNVHVLSDEGIYRCYRAVDGEVLKEKRPVGAVRASMVATEDHIFVTEKSGKTTVITNDSNWNVVAENELDEGVLASAAISNGDLIFRTTNHLVLIRDGNKQQALVPGKAAAKVR